MSPRADRAAKGSPIGRLTRATERLDDHRTLLGLLVLATVAFLAYVAYVSTTGPPFQSAYEVSVRVPADAPSLREGQAVRVGGKLAGLISGVEEDTEGEGRIVTANITKPEFRDLPADTSAYVRVHSLVYETYLELRPGLSDEKLVNGETVAEPATSGVDLLEVVQLFDEQTRHWLREGAVNVGQGLAGRGAGLNAALAELPALSADLNAQLGAATARDGELGRLVAGAGGTAAGLRGRRPDDVAAFITGTDTVAGAIAFREYAVRSTLRRLPGFQDQLVDTADTAEPALSELAALAPELDPAVRALNARLPDLNRLLASGDALSEDFPALAGATDPVLDEGRPVLNGLYPTMTALDPIAADLDRFLAGVEPYEAEIAQAGRRFADSTSHDNPNGLAPGAPAARFLPVLTEHPCNNPIPKPGEAQKDECDE